MPPRYPTSEEPISAAAPVTADIIAPLPVPSYGASGTFTIIARTRISASPLAVLNTIRDTTTWPKWNTFCPRGVIMGASKSKGKGIRSSTSTRTGVSDIYGERGKEGYGLGDFGRGGGDESQGWLEQGSEVLVDVFLSGDGLVPGRKRTRAQTIAVTLLERIIDSETEGDGVKRSGYRLAWKTTGWADWQYRSERVMEFVAREEGGTDYTCWETFSGVLGPVVKRIAGSSLCDRFGDYARDVKAFLEGTELNVHVGEGEANTKRRSI